MVPTPVEARRRLGQFRDRRNHALFHLTRFSGRDLASDLRETTEAARHALTVFGAGPPDACAIACSSIKSDCPETLPAPSGDAGFHDG